MFESRHLGPVVIIIAIIIGMVSCNTNQAEHYEKMKCLELAEKSINAPIPVDVSKLPGCQQAQKGH